MKLSFEEQMQQLEDIVRKLESDALPLEEAIDAYKKGIDLSKSIQVVLEQAKEVLVKEQE